MKLAVIEDGQIRMRGPLDDLRRAWKQASPEDRRRFLEEVGQTDQGRLDGSSASREGNPA